MTFSMRRVLTGAIALALAMAAAAQSKAGPARTPVATWKSYCHPAYGFCFRYPEGWTMLGETLGGNGVVVAPAQAQQRENWDAVTVALVVAPPETGHDPVTLDEAITQALTGARKSGQGFELQQRRQLTVADEPAEMVQVRYSEESSGREWVERLVFIAGPESEIYSVALKCAPGSVTQMEPLFSRIVSSWNLAAPASPPGDETKSPDTGPSPSRSAPPASVPPKP